MKTKTYGRGQILRIDLTTESISVEPIPEDMARKYLGGEGINSLLLWEHFLKTDPRVDPTSRENVIIAGIGPLGATGYGAGTKMKWTFKSPLTGIFGDSASGGAFAANLRYAGYDHIVITGRAKDPVYIWVHDDDVQIRNATHLWGMDVPEANRRIKEELGYMDVETACIGQTGENLVGFADIQVSGHRAAGRAGGGCVFGSKNLKAIAARGTKGIAIHDAQRFLQAADVLITRVNGMRQRDAWKNCGSMSIYGWYNRHGLSPFRNSQRPSAPTETYEKVSAHWYLNNLAIGPLACSPGCISGCSGLYHIKGDESPAAKEYAGETGYRVELTGQIGFGGLCDIPDMAALSHLWKMCCTYGIDAIELSECCGFLMELWQRGIISEQDTAEWFGEPANLEWGNWRVVAKIIESIALQQNQLGTLFKHGLYKAAQRIEELKGVPVLPYAVYGKGGVPMVSEIRSDPSWGTAFAVASRGADHLKGAIATLERFARPDLSCREFGTPEAAEPFTPTLKGRDCARAENRCAVINSLGLCVFLVGLDTAALPFDLFAEALSASTGVTVSAHQILAAGERTANLEKAFNSRLGLSRKDDRLCQRWMEEPTDHPEAQGMTASHYLDLTLNEYYEACGWDKETSLQTRQKLEELDMLDIADVLAQERALA
ncbi:aldehyde ferredoxin oxidoreductase family protein [Chloroflexota bacterium]